MSSVLTGRSFGELAFIRRWRGTAAIGLFAQAPAHGLEAGMDLLHLPFDPGLAALLRAAPGPGGFQPYQDGSVQQAVGQGLPGLDLGTLASLGRNELAHGRQRVHVFDDHA